MDLLNTKLYHKPWPRRRWRRGGGLLGRGRGRRRRPVVALEFPLQELTLLLQFDLVVVVEGVDPVGVQGAVGTWKEREGREFCSKSSFAVWTQEVKNRPEPDF